MNPSVPLPPLEVTSRNSFYTVYVSGTPFMLTRSALQHDAPNFFTEIFFDARTMESQTMTMYIDRNPDIFGDIIKHMQGYFVSARDEVHLENLMLDAYFFKLKRLAEYLRQTMFINVSGTLFKLSRDTINNDTPNFFDMLYPTADRNLTPTFISRSADLFKDILSHLQGYDITIRDSVHRKNLIKEAKYYRLQGLIQKLSTDQDVFLINGFPTRPEERTKAEVVMVLKNLQVKQLSLKGWVDLPPTASINFDIFQPLPAGGASPGATAALAAAAASVTGGSTPSPIPSHHQVSGGDKDTDMGQKQLTQAELDVKNKAIGAQSILQDILYRPSKEIDQTMSLLIELSSIELFAIWPGSVHSSMLGDQHLFVYRDFDLAWLNKICKRLQLAPLTQSANVIHLSPTIFVRLDGHAMKGQDELEPVIRKLALSSAQITPPGRALRLFLGRALVKMGCRAGQLVMTVVKAEGWSSDKEFNACRDYLSPDLREQIQLG